MRAYKNLEPNQKAFREMAQKGDQQAYKQFKTITKEIGLIKKELRKKGVKI
tara:strand:- start:440 stop:592 length:153 start_codon:yes stop_codon:yes gene_type:complete